MTHYLNLVRLRTDQSVQALLPILTPTDENERLRSTHHLLWSLFADEASRRRDFLFREIDDPAAPQKAWWVLSARPPLSGSLHSGLFDIRTRPFAPALEKGDLLHFVLRASISGRGPKPEGAARAPRIDPVAAELREIKDPAARAQARPLIIGKVCRDWLARRGERTGFAYHAGFQAAAEGRRSVTRLDGTAIYFQMFDLSGVLEVLDPAAFLSGLLAGHGQLKAFGCGLMCLDRISRALIDPARLGAHTVPGQGRILTG